jgi:serine protease Do
VVQITNEQQGSNPLAQSVPTGVGSGVIYDDRGHILTNNHVVEGAQRLIVTLPDKRTFTGKLVGTDAMTDLAVVQIDGQNLPKAQLGDTGELKVGEWVVAIGNALALPGGPTTTAGVVSALGRAVQEPGTGQAAGPFLLGLVQTDAAINPGNSGGPLVNLDGKVIGINTLGAGDAGNGVQATGIGFAIGSSTFTRVAQQIVANGKAIHPYIGIRYVPLNPAIAVQLGIDTNQAGGAVASVQPGSPAATAGIQPRDVITQIDGKALDSESALAEIIDGHKPGDTVTFTVLRAGKAQDLKVRLGEAP